MRNTQKVIAVVAYTLVAVAVGRYTVPQTVKIEKETTKQVDVVEKKDLNKQTDANRLQVRNDISSTWRCADTEAIRQAW